MRTVITSVLIMLCSTMVYSEEYRGTYSFSGEGGKQEITIVVDGTKAIQKDDIFNNEYIVVENSDDELFLMQQFTKKNSGAEYPVGISLMVLDKKTGAFVRSNTFAGGDQNNHALGTMKQVAE